jgi:uncharacterized protein YecT (DUF1311 family)
MKITFLILLMSASFAIAQTQNQMNEDAFQRYNKADLKLNNIYQTILVDYKSDTAFVKALKQAERLWVQYRDAQVEMMYPKESPGSQTSYYGSVYPMCVSEYMTSLTEDRIKILQQWIKGVEEGNGCSGSIRIKNE